jgi:dCMP deaminase
MVSPVSDDSFQILSDRARAMNGSLHNTSRFSQRQSEALQRMIERQEKWDRRYLELAKMVASWSKDPSTQTGAVFVRDNSVISLGYNGFPKGIADTEERLNDRETKYGIIVHCEMNALLTAKSSVRGATLYTWPFLSCDRCCVHMIQAGVGRVVAPALPPELQERWGKSIAATKALFREAGVSVQELAL